MSMNLTIVIQALDQASVVINNMANQASTAMKNLGANASGASKSFDALGQAATVAAGIIIRDLANSFSQAAVESLTLGGRFESLNSAFENVVSNIDGASLSLEDLRTATRNTVADVDLLKAANTALALGLPVNEIDELFASAMKLGRAMGIDTLDAVNSLSIGIGRQSRLVLDNLGIVFDAQTAYEWYAESIGKSVNELDESEKRLGWQQYAIKMVTEKAQELGDVTDDNITSQEQWNASFKNLETTLGTILGPLGAFKGLIADLLPIITTTAAIVIPQWISAHGGLKNSLIEVGTAIRHLPDTIRNLGTSLSHMSTSMKTAALGAAAFAISFGATYYLLQLVPEEYRQLVAVLAIVVSSLVAVAIAALAAYGALSWGTAIPIILGAIGVGVAGLVTYFQMAGIEAGSMGTEVTDATTEASLGVQGAGADAIDMGENFKGATDAITKGFDSATTSVSLFGTEIKGRINPAVENFKLTVEETATSKAWDDMIDSGEEIGAVFIDGEGNVKDWGQAIQDAFGNAGKSLSDFGSNIATTFHDAGAAVQTGFDNISNYIGGALSNASTTIQNWWGNVVSGWNNFTGQVQTAVSTGFNNLVGVVQGALSNVQATIAGGWANIQSVFSQALANISNFVQTGMANIQNWISNAMNTIYNFFATAWNNITSFVSSAVNNLYSAVSSGISNIQNFISGALNSIQNFFSNAWNTIKGIVQGAVNAIQSAISGGMSTVTGIIQGAVNAWQGVLNGFLSFIGGIANGIKNALGGISNLISGAVNAARGAASAIGGAISGITGGGARAEGGIFNQPTNVIVGELGPEVILPLNVLTSWVEKLAPKVAQGNGITQSTTGRPYIDQRSYKVYATIRGDYDVRKLARDLANYQAEEERAQGID